MHFTNLAADIQNLKPAFSSMKPIAL